MNYLSNLNNLKKKIDKEYHPLLNDLIRMLSILIITNLLMFFSNPSKNKFLGEYYVNIITFVVLGIMTYWLVIKKIVIFN